MLIVIKLVEKAGLVRAAGAVASLLTESISPTEDSMEESEEEEDFEHVEVVLHDCSASAANYSAVADDLHRAAEVVRRPLPPC